MEILKSIQINLTQSSTLSYFRCLYHQYYVFILHTLIPKLTSGQTPYTYYTYTLSPAPPTPTHTDTLENKALRNSSDIKTKIPVLINEAFCSALNDMSRYVCWQCTLWKTETRDVTRAKQSYTPQVPTLPFVCESALSFCLISSRLSCSNYETKSCMQTN